MGGVSPRYCGPVCFLLLNLISCDSGPIYVLESPLPRGGGQVSHRRRRTDEGEERRKQVGKMASVPFLS